jgi:hypothetical protein
MRLAGWRGPRATHPRAGVGRLSSVDLVAPHFFVYFTFFFFQFFFI